MLDDETIAKRSEFIANVDSTLSQFESKIKSILSTLSFTAESLQSDQNTSEEQYYTCPFDPSHQVPPRSYERHFEKCALKEQNIKLDKSDEVKSTLYFYQNCPSVVSFVPKTSSSDDDMGIRFVNNNPAIQNMIEQTTAFSSIPPQYRRFVIPQQELMRFKGWLLNMSGLSKDVSDQIFEVVKAHSGAIDLDGLATMMNTSGVQGGDEVLTKLWKTWVSASWKVPLTGVDMTKMQTHAGKNIIYQYQTSTSTPLHSVPSNQRFQEHNELIYLSQTLRKQAKVKRGEFKSVEELIEKLQEAKDRKSDTASVASKSHKQVISEQRDYKRRRQRYRVKASKSRNITEVFRDVIQHYMDDFEMLSQVERKNW